MVSSARVTKFLALALLVAVLIAGTVQVTALLKPYEHKVVPSGVVVLRGPSPIPEGDAVSVEDITLMNEYLVVSIGVGSTPPWGVPKGNIMDAAPRAPDGEILQDTLAQFSFPVNGWGNWAKFDTIEVVENTSEVGIVRAVGYWDNVRVEVTYKLEAGKRYLEITTVVTNEGGSPYVDLVSGYAMSLERGWTFTPGFGTGRHYAPTLKEELGVLEDWVAGYHEDFAIVLWAPYYTHLSTSTSWVDPFTIHTLEPGETVEFKGYLVMIPEGSICRALKEVLDLKGASYSLVYGYVTSAEGELIETPIAVVSVEGKPYCWDVGSEGMYSVYLTPGTYSLHGEARNYGPGEEVEVTVSEAGILEVNLTGLASPGAVEVTVVRSGTGEPLDAKILVSGGVESIIQYLRVGTVYTDLEEVGKATFNLAPGTYTISVGHGDGFISKPVVFEGVSIESGEEVELTAEVEILIEPWEMGWYSADLHHHSNILDGRTPPEYLVLAQSAAALDFIFVSDHDSVANHEIIAELAAERGKPFIPSVEVSPSWGHFNPYPIPLGVDIVYRWTVDEIFEAARVAGAIVIRVNHPWTTSAYFKSLDLNEVPGGYNPDWDVAEINGFWGSSDNKTLTYMWGLWDNGLQYYLTAGSDTHDVFTSPYSGYPRVYAYIEGEPTPEAFALAEKNGHTFISYGPLIFTDPIPGSVIFAGEGEEVSVEVRLFAVDGVSRVIIYGTGGERLLDETYEDTPTELTMTFKVPIDEVITLKETGWIQVAVWDADGDLALSNPIWVTKAGVKAVVTETTTVTETVTQTLTETTTLTETETETLTETVTETETSTVTEVTTETTTLPPEVRWDVTAGLAVVTLIVGVGLGYLVLKARK